MESWVSVLLGLVAIKRNCPGTETRMFVVLSYGVSHVGVQDKVGGPKNTFVLKPGF